MPIVESFYNLKENREYLFSIKSSDKPDLLIESEFGVIGIEMTTSSSTEIKGGSETRQIPNKQKGQLKKLLKEKESFATDSVIKQITENDIESLMKVMVKRIREKDDKKSYDVENPILLVELIEEFYIVAYGPDKNNCYQTLEEGEKLNDFFYMLRFGKIIENLKNLEIKNFKNLIIFVTPSRLYPSCFNFKITNNRIEEEMKSLLKVEKENFEKK
jgi:hypothetical protein